MKCKYVLIPQILFAGMVFHSCDFGRHADSHVDKVQWYSSLAGSDSATFFLLEKEQQQEKLKLWKFLLENTQVAGDSMFFDGTESDFVKQGLPKEYYDFYLSDLHCINNFPFGTDEFKRALFDNHNALRDSSLHMINALIDD